MRAVAKLPVTGFNGIPLKPFVFLPVLIFCCQPKTAALPQAGILKTYP
jgi:hypothetical protein